MPPTKPAAKKQSVRIPTHPRPVTEALTLAKRIWYRLPISSPLWLLDDLTELQRLLLSMDASTGKPDAARRR